MNKLNEKQIIDIFKKQLNISNNSNDVEYFNPNQKNVIVKIDTMVSSTDIPKKASLVDMARKSVVACVSDFAAKGARPKYGILSITLPKNFTIKTVKDLTKGFKHASKEFKINFLGGDTNEGKELSLSVCLFGLADQISMRDSCHVGDVIFTTGPFGYSAAGLKILLGKHTSKIFTKKALDAFCRPIPKLTFGLSACKYFSSSMDSSDGLSTTLHELARQSKNKIILGTLPFNEDLRKFAKTKNQLYNLVLHGGEEYEIVVTCLKKNYPKIQNIASRYNVKLIKIGYVAKGHGVVLVDNSSQNKLLDKGWSHFT